MGTEYGHQENDPRAARLRDCASSIVIPGHLFFPIDGRALVSFLLLYYNVIHIGGTKNMAASILVQARIDRAVKEEAAIVLGAIGLTVSDAVRLLLTKVAREKALPFETLIPNAETIKAMKEARRGRLASFKSIKALTADLQKKGKQKP
jgi:DNA-damage-inducible protein J